MSKKRLICLLWLLLCGLGLCFAENASPAGEQLLTQDWDWEPSVVNAFEGVLDLSAAPAGPVTLRVQAVFEPAAEAEAPVFTVVNGSRITILHQSDTVTLTPEEVSPLLPFSGTLRMPASGRFSQVELSVTALDASGQVLRTLTEPVSRSPVRVAASEGVFRIPFDIRTVALYLGIAAVLLWAVVLWREVSIRKKSSPGRNSGRNSERNSGRSSERNSERNSGRNNRMGDKEHADL